MIIMNEERFNQRLKEANKGYEDSLKMIKAQKELDKSERIMDSPWLAHHMNLAHMRSTLRYINGEVDNLFEEIRYKVSDFHVKKGHSMSTDRQQDLMTECSRIIKSGLQE